MKIYLVKSWVYKANVNINYYYDSQLYIWDIETAENVYNDQIKKVTFEQNQGTNLVGKVQLIEIEQQTKGVICGGSILKHFTKE